MTLVCEYVHVCIPTMYVYAMYKCTRRAYVYAGMEGAKGRTYTHALCGHVKECLSGVACLGACVLHVAGSSKRLFLYYSVRG